MNDRLFFRWLGVAGLEFTYASQTLLIDPYLTRISFWQQFCGPVQSNLELVQRYLPRADYILVTHAHYDHLLDVPGIALRTGAVVYGSPNTCRLCQVLGLPGSQVHIIEAGTALDLGPFHVETALKEHMPLPFFTPGPLPERLKPPLGVFSYRMDVDFTFMIEVSGLRLITSPGINWNLLPPCDALFVLPYHKMDYYRSLLKGGTVKRLIPNHWDDFWRPLDKPLLSQHTPPNMAWPPLLRFNLFAWKEKIEQISPGTQVLVPEIFKSYEIR